MTHDLQQLLTIKEVSERYDLSYRTLRFYEERRLINPTRLGSTRFYCQSDLVRIELIVAGRRLGFTLAEIYSILSKSSYNDRKIKFVQLLSERDIATHLKVLQERYEEMTNALGELKLILAATGTGAPPESLA